MPRPDKRVRINLSAISIVAVPEELSCFLLIPVEVFPYGTETRILRIGYLLDLGIPYTNPTREQLTGIRESFGIAVMIVDKFETVRPCIFKIIGRDVIGHRAAEVV